MTVLEKDIKELASKITDGTFVQNDVNKMTVFNYLKDEESEDFIGTEQDNLLWLTNEINNILNKYYNK